MLQLFYLELVCLLIFVYLYVCLFVYSRLSSTLSVCLSCLLVVWQWGIFPTWRWCNHCHHRSILRTVDKHASSWKTVCHLQSQLKLFMFLSLAQFFSFHFWSIALHLCELTLCVWLYGFECYESVHCTLYSWCKCGLINVHLNSRTDTKISLEIFQLNWRWQHK